MIYMLTIANKDSYTLLLMIFGFMLILGLFGSKITGLFLISPHTVKTAQSLPADRIQPSKSKSVLIEITLRDCNQCFSFKSIKQQLMDKNFITASEIIFYPGAEAKKLIKAYKINTLPAMIITNLPKGAPLNDLKKFGIIKGPSFIFHNKTPVYYDLRKKRFVGGVKLIELIDRDCNYCFDPLRAVQIKTLLEESQNAFEELQGISSKYGQSLIKKYFIDFAPALIFSPEIGDYNRALFARLGSFSSDGTFVVRKKYAPYRDLTTGDVRGLLSVKIVDARSCWACKGAKDLLAFLQKNFGLSFSSVKVYDLKDPNAKTLIEGYGLHYLPAAVITGDTKSYPIFGHVWPKIGRVFANGAYSIDGFPFLGAGYYYDTNTNKIVPALLKRKPEAKS